MGLDEGLVWWGPAAAGVDGARRSVAQAAAVLGRSAPRDWRAVSAQAYATRLDGLLRHCTAVADEVEEAAAHVRLLQAELAAGRGALVAAGTPWWSLQ